MCQDKLFYFYLQDFLAKHEAAAENPPAFICGAAKLGAAAAGESQQSKVELNVLTCTKLFWLTDLKKKTKNSAESKTVTSQQLEWKLVKWK